MSRADGGREPVTPTWTHQKTKMGRPLLYPAGTGLVVGPRSRVAGAGVRVQMRVQVHWGEARFDCGVAGRPRG